MRLPPVDLEFLACLISGLFWRDVIARISPPSLLDSQPQTLLEWPWIFHFACGGLCLGNGRFNQPHARTWTSTYVDSLDAGPERFRPSIWL